VEDFFLKIIAKSSHKSGFLLSWSKVMYKYAYISVLDCARTV